MLSQKGRKSSDREALLLLTVVNNPGVLEPLRETLVSVDFSDSALDKLRRRILEVEIEGDSLDSKTLRRHLENSEDARHLHRLLQHKGNQLVRFARPDADPEEAMTGFMATLSLHLHDGELKTEVRQAAAECGQARSDAADERLKAMVFQRRRSVARSTDEEETSGETPRDQ